MKAYELAKKLFEGEEVPWSTERVIQQVLCAYADSHDGLKEERNLSFFCPRPVDGFMAMSIAKKCIVSYNAFNEETMSEVVDYFGTDALYFFAREGSVCIYVRPVLKSVWFSEENKLECEQDEFSFDASLQMFRIWWD